MKVSQQQLFCRQDSTKKQHKLQDQLSLSRLNHLSDRQRQQVTTDIRTQPSILFGCCLSSVLREKVSFACRNRCHRRHRRHHRLAS